MILRMMKSVYCPGQVVLLLRRIVNVISTLSLSNQYLLLHQASSDEKRRGVESSSSSLKQPGDEWPWWAYKRDWPGEWTPQVFLENRPVKPYQELSMRGNHFLILFTNLHIITFHRQILVLVLIHLRTTKQPSFQIVWRITTSSGPSERPSTAPRHTWASSPRGRIRASSDFSRHHSSINPESCFA